MILPALTAGLVAIAAPVALAQTTYSLDDGRGNPLGPAFDEWDMVFINAFHADPAGERLNRASVCWGSAPAGLPAEILILHDPDQDGSPATASLLASVPAATNPLGNGVFADYDLPGVCVRGWFFVAARVRVSSGGLVTRPARLDTDARANAPRAFLAVGSVVNAPNFLDLDNLGDAPIFYRMSDYAFPGVWLLRAQGLPGPACPADYNADGFADFFDFDAFIADFEAGRPCADFNRDAFIDFFDADEFVLAFEAGC